MKQTRIEIELYSKENEKSEYLELTELEITDVIYDDKNNIIIYQTKIKQ